VEQDPEVQPSRRGNAKGKPRTRGEGTTVKAIFRKEGRPDVSPKTKRRRAVFSYERREGFGGWKGHTREILLAPGGNAVNPRIGSGLQYIRRLQKEEPVEEAQNLGDGTKQRFRSSLFEGTGQPASGSGLL